MDLYQKQIQLPAITRLVITQKGNCFAKFDDSSTIYLSNSCEIIYEINSNNKLHTHVIHFINDRLQHKITQILNINNIYYPTIKLTPFMTENRKKTQHLSNIQQAIWSQRCIPTALQTNEKQITSSDANTTMILHNNKQTFSVTFPVCIKKEIEIATMGNIAIFYDHINIQQIQSVNNFETCWHLTLQLISKEIENIEQKEEFESKQSSIISTVIPLPKILMIENVSKGMENNHRMTHMTENCLQSINYFHCTTNALPDHELLCVEWNMNAVYKIFFINDAQFLIEIFIAFDGSYIVSNVNHKFFYHSIPNCNERYVYSIDGIPPHAPNCNVKYDLNGIGKYGVKLLQKTMENFNFINNQNANKNHTDDKLCDDVKVFYTDLKYGEFTYFTDGRIRVLFCDRTILDLNQQWNKCQIITKWGEQLLDIPITNGNVNENAKEYKKYISIALNFGHWSQMSKNEQLKYQQSQMKVRYDIQQSMKRNQILIDTHHISGANANCWTMLTDVQDFKMENYNLNDGEYKLSDNKVLLKGLQSQIQNINRLLSEED